MKLIQLRICNFQSFGSTPGILDLPDMCFLVGPNGAGKTTVLEALSRLFCANPSMRRVQASDFHRDTDEDPEAVPSASALSIDAVFEFTELNGNQESHATIPTFFAHMLLESAGGNPRMRVRLDATIDEDREVAESISYVLQVDENGEPTKKVQMFKHDRSAIQVHYLPARRDPTEHVSYAANSLLGRALRSADWQAENSEIARLTEEINSSLGGNSAITSIGAQLGVDWNVLHRSVPYANPTISFGRGEINNLLRHLTVRFAPGIGQQPVDYSQLSDGQQSLFYLALVLAIQAIGRKVLAGEVDGFDPEKFRPPVFTIVAMEEPENSLSPHYLGRIVKTLMAFACHHDAQAIVATHAPSMLKRVPPENIRYLRLDASRETVIKSITMPANTEEGYKYVREAVQAFPELYFSRLVILGEGDSEEIVLPRLLQASGLAADDNSIVVVPLGGRHVNHFWRLLNDLEIAHATLLDLDLSRNQGGWGRVRYVTTQILALAKPIKGLTAATIEAIPKWNDAELLLASTNGKKWLAWLEEQSVYFSSPLDLDLALLRSFPTAYGVQAEELAAPESDTLVAVLGKNRHAVEQYDDSAQQYFAAYHRLFKLRSKPVSHLTALSSLDDQALLDGAPGEIKRLLDAVEARLVALPE